MIATIVLDSTPLGLLFQRVGIPAADACRKWIERHSANHVNVVVPEVVTYELRRELLRLGKYRAITQMRVFLASLAITMLPIRSADLTLAAQLWADSRRRGLPTADPQALDIDVILAAQVLNSHLNITATVVATSNVKHLSQFVPAREWAAIV